MILLQSSYQPLYRLKWRRLWPVPRRGSTTGKVRLLGIHEPCISSLHTCTAADIMASKRFCGMGFYVPTVIKGGLASQAMSAATKALAEAQSDLRASMGKSKMTGTCRLSRAISRHPRTTASSTVNDVLTRRGC
jgi:hypothetical protein